MYLIIDFSKNFDLYSNKILEIDYKNISNEKNGEIWKNQNFNADLPMKELLSFIIIDKQNKSPIGYNICSQKKDTIHIHRFCIDKEYQNKGYEDFKSVSEQYQGYQNYLKNTEIDCKAKRQHYIYISAEGDVFPCGFLSDRMYGYESENHQDHKTMMDIIESIGGRTKINLHYTSLNDIVHGDWFDAIEHSWTDNSIQRCAHMCGNESTLIKNANFETIKVWSGPNLV